MVKAKDFANLWFDRMYQFTLGIVNRGFSSLIVVIEIHKHRPESNILLIANVTSVGMLVKVAGCIIPGNAEEWIDVNGNIAPRRDSSLVPYKVMASRWVVFMLTVKLFRVLAADSLS